MMGAIAQTVHEGGGKVIGVIPEAIKKIERPGTRSMGIVLALLPFFVK